MRLPNRRILLAAATVVVLGAVLLYRFASGPGPSSFYPLPPGAWWNYGVEGAPFQRLQARVTGIQGSGDDASTIVEVVVPETGEIWHTAAYGVDDLGIVLLCLEWEEGDSLYRQVSPGHILKSPLRDGHSWSWETPYSDVSGREPDMLLEATFTVGVRETVTVPAGTYEGALRVTRVNRFQVRDGWYEVTQVLWYAHGVGMILEEHYRDDALVGRCFLVDWDAGG